MYYQCQDRTIGQRIGLGGMRHVETRYLWVQEEIRSRRQVLKKVKGMENATDLATKHVDTAALQKRMTTTGLVSRTRVEILRPECLKQWEL